MTALNRIGLQAERTAMAWQRTALGVGGVSAPLPGYGSMSHSWAAEWFAS